MTTRGRIQGFLYQPNGMFYVRISFDGVKWWNIKRSNVLSTGMMKKTDYVILYTDNDLVYLTGRYDRGDKTLTIFDNAKIIKAYSALIKDQKLGRLNQSFLISEYERKERKKMPIVDDWMNEFGQNFLNHENVKRGDKFTVTNIEQMEHEAWKSPRIVFTVIPKELHSKTKLKEGEEYLAGMGKQNLQRFIEEFGTSDDEEWLQRDIEVAVIQTYNMPSGKQKGIVWAVVEATE